MSAYTYVHWETWNLGEALLVGAFGAIAGAIGGLVLAGGAYFIAGALTAESLFLANMAFLPAAGLLGGKSISDAHANVRRAQLEGINSQITAQRELHVAYAYFGLMILGTGLSVYVGGKPTCLGAKRPTTVWTRVQGGGFTRGLGRVFGGSADRSYILQALGELESKIAAFSQGKVRLFVEMDSPDLLPTEAARWMPKIDPTTGRVLLNADGSLDITVRFRPNPQRSAIWEEFPRDLVVHQAEYGGGRLESIRSIPRSSP